MLLPLSLSSPAALQKGRVSAPNGFAFIGKFCFQYLPSGAPVGTVSLDLSMPLYNDVQSGGARGGQTDQTDIALVLFDDQEESWPLVMAHWDEWSCQEKMAHSKGHYQYSPSEWSHAADGHTVTLSASLTSISQRLRPRFWYFALSRCHGGFEAVSYHLHTTQSVTSSWSKEFGSNDVGLNTLYILLFLLTGAMVVAHGYSTLELHAAFNQYLHPLLKLLIGVMALEMLSVFALMVHYCTYARDGIGSPPLLHWGTLLDILSRGGFMLLLLLLAKGWTISHERLTQQSIIVTLVGGSTVLSCLIAFWAWGEDPRRDSPTFGRGSLDLLQTALWCWFAVWFVALCYEGWQTEQKDDEKRRLYLWLAVIFGPWFILPPLAPMLSFLIDPWAREHVVLTWVTASNLLAYSAMAALFWHTRAQNYFSIATPDVSQRGGEYEQL